MTEQLWLTFLQNAGVAMVMLVALGMAAWRFFTWFGKRLDEWLVPVVKKHLEFVTLLEGHLTEMQLRLEQQTRNLEQQTVAMTTQTGVMEKMLVRIERLESIQNHA